MPKGFRWSPEVVRFLSRPIHEVIADIRKYGKKRGKKDDKFLREKRNPREDRIR